jgi:hypothetical protein
MKRGVGTLVVVSSALFLSGCDLFGPSGPGTIEATFSGPQPIGGLVLEVTGPGIEGFEGTGSTQALGAVVSAAEGTHRVVAIVPVGPDVRIGIRVSDLGDESPQFTVISATTPTSMPLGTGGIQVRVER